jgi:hypothetical protein
LEERATQPDSTYFFLVNPNTEGEFGAIKAVKRMLTFRIDSNCGLPQV